MKQKVVAASTALMLISGAVAACIEKPMPFLGIVDSGLGGMVDKWFDGYRNPARADMLGNLDSRASMAVGAENWRANKFVGHVTYNTPFGGTNIVYTEKPCGTKALDTEPKSGGGGSDTGGASVTGETGYWDFVLQWSIQQDWERNYDDLYGEVGPIHPV